MLRSFSATDKLQSFLKDFKDIGFVPTMGNLHSGHLSLLSESYKNHELSVISIFVNPTQFGKNEDFGSYPRTLEQDLQQIEKIGFDLNKIIVFAPSSVTEVYPHGLEHVTKVTGPTRVLEGAVRPEHFDGVTTVVRNLFEIISPKIAYFGKKDYQQLILIKQLVEQYSIKTKVVGLPIVRDTSGLALSSRNGNLSEKELIKALELSSSIKEVYQCLLASKSLEKSDELINKIKNEKPELNYLEVREKSDLSVPQDFHMDLIVLGNMQVNKTRLLDNIELEEAYEL